MKVDDAIDRLSGGTLFSLMVHAMRPRSNSVETSTGKIEGVTEESCMKTLIGIMYKPYSSFGGNSLKTNLNLYKKCEKGSGAGIRIEDDVLKESFRKKLHEAYFDLHKEMEAFVKKYINSGMQDWLIYAVLELIYGDDYIRGEELLFLLNSGKSIKKTEIIENHDYSAASVLIGAWFYIVDTGIDNEDGKNTFERWHKTEKYKKPVFLSKIGEDNILKIQLIKEKSAEIHLEVENGTRDRSYLLKYAEYIAGVKGKYSEAKSYLYRKEPRPFYDFFVCNNVQESVAVAGKNGSWYKPNVIKSVTIEDLLRRSSFLIISGTAGIGKSMMMQHLMNDAIKKYEKTGLIPIFVPLKKYDSSYKNIESYVYSYFGLFDESLAEEDLKTLLSNGQSIVLFDGLDEIGSSDLSQFEIAVDGFVERYKKNVFVISSRPRAYRSSLERFTNINVLPFTKEQAIQLVDRLQFGEDNEDFRESFKEKLKKGMYDTHKSLVMNPLLLTLMMMTYEDNADVPTERYLFYSKAYHALAEKHDAKKNSLKRTLSTGLSVDRLKAYLAEFSAKTYRDGEKEFDEEKIDRYFSRLKRRQEDVDSGKEINVSDFIEDLVSKVCIMYEDNGKYQFIHDSFQDYFCALFFSQQKDKMLQEIGNMFEKRMHDQYDDQAFSMLYDMIPKHVEEYIFLPLLRGIIGEGESSLTGYEHFLLKAYPYITYYSGAVLEDTDNKPASSIYSFIAELKDIKGDISTVDMPHYKSTTVKKYKYVIRDSGELELIPYDILSEKSKEGEEAKKPDGILSRINTAEVLSSKDDYRDLISIIEDKEFPLYREYESAITYMNSINTEEVSEDKDLFEYLD